jgi:hypothetical protein
VVFISRDLTAQTRFTMRNPGACAGCGLACEARNLFRMAGALMTWPRSTTSVRLRLRQAERREPLALEPVWMGEVGNPVPHWVGVAVGPPL